MVVTAVTASGTVYAMVTVAAVVTSTDTASTLVILNLFRCLPVRSGSFLMGSDNQ